MINETDIVLPSPVPYDNRFESAARKGSKEHAYIEAAKRDADKIAALEAKLGKTALVLNPIGSRTIKECEAVIESGMTAHVDAWLALKEIHDRKLYRPGYDDFKEYCEGRWGYRQEGYRYLRAASVTTVVTPGLPPPPSSAHAGALAPLLDEPEKLKEAWGLALELNDGHPTFLEVRDIVAGYLPPKPQPPSESILPTSASEIPSGILPSESPSFSDSSVGESGSDGTPGEVGESVSTLIGSVGDVRLPHAVPDSLPNAPALGPTKADLAIVHGISLRQRDEPPMYDEWIALTREYEEAIREIEVIPPHLRKGPTPSVGIAPGGEYVERRMLTPEELGTLPKGYYTREQVLDYHNRFNGLVRSASKYLSDPAIRVWFVSLYEFTRKTLETENLL